MHPSLLDLVARGALVVLVNGLWQGAAITLVTWVALRLSPRANASTRYLAWTFALAATVVVPIVTSLSHITYEPVATPFVAGHTHAYAAQAAKQQAPAVSAQSASSQSTTPAARGGTALPHVPAVHIDAPTMLTAALFALWALAALVLVVRLAVALMRLEGLKRDALPLRMEYRDRLVRWQSLENRDRDVRICVTEGIQVPVAVGLFDAMVLLPQHLLDTLDAEEIDQISIHELAHLLRHDDWSNGFQRIVTALFFFNPAVWFIARQMDVEREVACDDYVLELTGAVRSYAFCLTKMAEMTAWPHAPLAAPGVFTTRKNISIRIERLLRTGRAIGSSISPATAVAVVIGLALGFAIARLMTPVVAFAMPAVPAPPIALPVISATKVPARTLAIKPYSATMPKMTIKEPAVNLTVPSLTIPAMKYRVPPTKANLAPMKINVAGVTVALPSLAATLSLTHPHPSQVAVSSEKEEDIRGGCTGCDFSNAKLSGRDFSNQNLTGSNFDDADLHGARFDHSNLSGTNFNDANLRNASFVGANLTGCNLQDADLAGARFDGARLAGCSVDVSSLAPGQVQYFLRSCTGCDFADANLSGLNLRGVEVTGADMADAKLRNTDLSHALFRGVNFSDADFTGARLDGTEFDGCNFSGANLSAVDLSRARFVGSSLSDANMKP
jgi:uncharacterized protein YjbI with pentapeptide repeats/beta-lactamase regulating signal transducer with metallopeptidase domain